MKVFNLLLDFREAQYHNGITRFLSSGAMKPVFANDGTPRFKPIAPNWEVTTYHETINI